MRGVDTKHGVSKQNFSREIKWMALCVVTVQRHFRWANECGRAKWHVWGLRAQPLFWEGGQLPLRREGRYLVVSDDTPPLIEKIAKTSVQINPTDLIRMNGRNLKRRRGRGKGGQVLAISTLNQRFHITTRPHGARLTSLLPHQTIK